MIRRESNLNLVYAKVFLGEEGLDKSWQKEFTPETKCVHCNSDARIAFVNHEKDENRFIADLHSNEEESMWPHDATAVAVYFCKSCLKPTALFNQG